MKTLTVRLPEILERQVSSAAMRAGVSKASLVRDAIDAYLERSLETNERSAFDAFEGIIGVLSGPHDLATNPKHMEGFGQPVTNKESG